MLSVDLSSFMNTWYDFFLLSVRQFIALLKNTIVFTIGSTPITAFNIVVGSLVVCIVLGMFVYIAPRMNNKGV